jgi:hypothetical protein
MNLNAVEKIETFLAFLRASLLSWPSQDEVHDLVFQSLSHGKQIK